jgi:hypothetical protein
MLGGGAAATAEEGRVLVSPAWLSVQQLRLARVIARQSAQMPEVFVAAPAAGAWEETLAFFRRERKG